MTQKQLGRLLGSSQSRAAKMEAADPSVSIDLMVRSLAESGCESEGDRVLYGGTRSKRAA